MNDVCDVEEESESPQSSFFFYDHIFSLCLCLSSLPLSLLSFSLSQDIRDTCEGLLVLGVVELTKAIISSTQLA